MINRTKEIPRFFLKIRDIKDEFKNITWPSKKKTIRLTLVVFVISFVIALYVGAIDFVLAKVLEVITQR